MDKEVSPDRIVFKIPGKAISMNQIYAPIGRGQIMMVKKAKEFREKAILFTPYWKELKDHHNPKLSFEVWVFDRWYRKDGKGYLRKDVGNLRKVLIDAICYKWGIDDKHVWRESMYKEDMVEGEDQKIIVRVKVL